MANTFKHVERIEVTTDFLDELPEIRNKLKARGFAIIADEVSKYTHPGNSPVALAIEWRVIGEKNLW